MGCHDALPCGEDKEGLGVAGSRPHLRAQKTASIDTSMFHDPWHLLLVGSCTILVGICT
jgi:hypothetical protein